MVLSQMHFLYGYMYIMNTGICPPILNGNSCTFTACGFHMHHAIALLCSLKPCNLKVPNTAT